MTARCGRRSASLKLETALSNVTGAHITRGYRWWTAAGARRSMKDDGLTFGTNAHGGVCIHFRDKVPSPLSRKGHSALTVTVEDLEGLVQRADTGSRLMPVPLSLRLASPSQAVASGR